MPIFTINNVNASVEDNFSSNLLLKKNNLLQNFSNKKETNSISSKVNIASFSSTPYVE
ncbi:MAG: hypothetical protein U9Q66_02610 [Patescibacteria group bacterium]|nr:hypothetical protein [Patescibacteria group bacterium]